MLHQDLTETSEVWPEALYVLSHGLQDKRQKCSSSRNPQELQIYHHLTQDQSPATGTAMLWCHCPKPRNHSSLPLTLVTWRSPMLSFSAPMAVLHRMTASSLLFTCRAQTRAQSCPQPCSQGALQPRLCCICQRAPARQHRAAVVSSSTALTHTHILLPQLHHKCPHRKRSLQVNCQKEQLQTYLFPSLFQESKGHVGI